jgi:hypothetical protein
MTEKEPIENVIKEEVKKVVKEADIAADFSVITDDDVLKAFETDAPMVEEYIDTRLVTVQRVRALLRLWHEVNTEIVSIKEQYQLAKSVGDAQLEKTTLENGKPMVMKKNWLDSQLQGLLPELTNVPFLMSAEMSILPKWMLIAMGRDPEEEKA